jgi:hypothetical protein
MVAAVILKTAMSDVEHGARPHSISLSGQEFLSLLLGNDAMCVHSDISIERYHALSGTTMDSLLESLESLLDDMGNPAYGVNTMQAKPLLCC